MNSVTEYWTDVRTAERALPAGECHWVISIASAHRSESVGGMVVEVGSEHAARAIVEGTHRLASREEIEAHQRRQAIRSGALHAEALAHAVRYERETR